MLAKLGVQVPMSDLFAERGLDLLAGVDAPAPYVARIQSLQRLIDVLDVEVEVFARLAKGRLVADPGYRAVQTIPGIGPVLAAVFDAEIGHVHRFPTPAHLASWAGLTPKHHESDRHVRRGRITKQGSTLVRWAAIESVKRVGAHTGVGPLREPVADRRGRNIGAVAVARRQVEHVLLRPARRTRPRPASRRGMTVLILLGRCSVVQVMTPEPLGAVARFD